jgi:hypothetical protein
LFFSSFHANATNLVCLPFAKTSFFSFRNVIDENSNVFPIITTVTKDIEPIRSHSDSMVIVSPIFPPEDIYEILISVETPVANNPFDEAARDLPSQQDQGLRLPAEVNHSGDCSAMKDLKTICMMFLYFELCDDFARG